MSIQTHKWVIGNWKMNPDSDETELLLDSLGKESAQIPNAVAVGICPPTLWLQKVRHAMPTQVHIGSQDISAHTNGAHTGDISASMITSMGASMAIIGHSERRASYNESDQLVAEKAMQAFAHNLIPIVCVGELLADRQQQQHLEVVTAQLTHTLEHLARNGVHLASALVAYEPIWAIGTGKIPTADDIAQMHQAIRALLDANGGVRGILYGGSVKASNAADLIQIAGVDGFLVGGASLIADEFVAIISACA